jgi:ribosomal protein S18 acetylase RimI-like enzyme
MSLDLLDDVLWHSLTGPQAAVSTGTDRARRYAPGFSPIIGFADLQRPDFAALEPYCAAGEPLYCAGWSGVAPPGWQIDAEAWLLKMVWQGACPAPDDDFAAVRLGPAHVPQMLELVALTKPGPFGPRTIELGEYFGCFDGGRLVAMAGERMHAGRLREVSGVCTHPDFQGRGLARRLMLKLIRREVMRDEIPFLHVLKANPTAHQMYQRMGFGLHQEQLVRVLSRPS